MQKASDAMQLSADHSSKSGKALDVALSAVVLD
jgi:hypothetical protein